MSIASEIQRLQTDRTAIQSALVAQGISAASSHGFDDFAADIASISGGGSTDEISYPAWLKDGDTHLWLDIRNTYQLDQQLRIRMIGTIDWGDGSTVESVSVTAYTTFTHTYSAPGKYRIDLHPTSGTFYLGGAGTAYNVMGTRSGRNHAISAMYQAEVGASRITKLSNCLFYYCYGLLRLYVPKTIVTIDSSYAIGYCYSLREVVFEDSSTINNTTAGGGSVFYYDHCLQDVHGYAPPSIETMSSWYRQCNTIGEITIPESITKIQSYAINGCSGLKVIHCLPTTPPTIADANAFAPPTTCVIEVPSASLADYQAANIWANYASQMVGV